MQIIEDYIVDEVEASLVQFCSRLGLGFIEEQFSTHLLVDLSYDKILDDLNSDDLSNDEIIDWISNEAESVYKARESLFLLKLYGVLNVLSFSGQSMRNGKIILYAMDQLREGINLRAYGQKNPLLEYKSEGFGMFKEMMNDECSYCTKDISDPIAGHGASANYHIRRESKMLKLSIKTLQVWALQGSRKDNKMYHKRDRLPQ